jgi:phosphatidylserine decarboxylase
VVTVIDTDVAGGTGVGWVAMIEVVALMVGDIVQCYSESEYKDPQPLGSGCFSNGVVPKACSAGSSTTVLLFQKDRNFPRSDS